MSLWLSALGYAILTIVGLLVVNWLLNKLEYRRMMRCSRCGRPISTGKDWLIQGERVGSCCVGRTDRG